MKRIGYTHCTVEGCNRKHHSQGYCGKHWHQITRHGQITPDRERQRYGPEDKCSVEGCANRPHILGMCNKHSLQMSRHGVVYERTFKDPNEIILHNDYAEIVLLNMENEPFAMCKIDLEDIEKVAPFHWGATWSADSALYVQNDKVGRLHRFLMNAPLEKVVDHINHDTLDNRKNNLRVCDQSQNLMNASPRKNSKSGVKGVYFLNREQKWASEINYHKKRIYLGSSKDINEMIAIRKWAEKVLFGDFNYKELG